MNIAEDFYENLGLRQIEKSLRVLCCRAVSKLFEELQAEKLYQQIYLNCCPRYLFYLCLQKFGLFNRIQGFCGLLV